MSHSAKPSICTACGSTYFNYWAHAEECPGPVRHTKPCPFRLNASAGVRYQCSLPQGHKGGHRL